MTTITVKLDPETREPMNSPSIPIVEIDTSKIPLLEGRLIGGTFYAAMVRFYENLENVRRFEAWQKERGAIL